MARLIAMGILSDESGDVRRRLCPHVAGDEEERVELGDESFFGAEEFHQSVHIVRHEPGILPCVALGVVVLTVYGAEGIERLAELSVARRGLLPVAPDVPEVRGLRLAHAGVQVSLGVLRAVLAAVAVSVHHVDVLERAALDELLRLLDVDAGEARRHGARVGARRLHDRAERLAVALVRVEVAEHQSVALVVQLERA